MKAKTTIAKSTLVGLLLMALTPASFATDLPQYLNFDGQLLDASNNPISGSVPVVFEIYNPAGNCLLYKETRTLTLVSTDLGEFSVKVGPDGGGTSSAEDGDISWYTIFQNNAQVRAAGTNCSSGYTPAVGHARILRVTVSGSPLTPDFILAPVPMASVAQTLQGKLPADFVATNPSAGVSIMTADLRLDNAKSLRLGNLGSPSTQFVSLHAHPSSSTYDLTFPANVGMNGQVLTTDGTGILSWSSPSGGGITSINGDVTSSHLLAIGTTGGSPHWTTSAGTHTIHIPMASTVGTTAGLISKADYDNFNAKLSSIPASSVTSAQIVDDTIATGDIIDGAITNAKLGTDIDAAKITAGLLSLARLPAIPNSIITSLEVSKITSATGYFSYAPGGVSCANGELLKWNFMTGWECAYNMNMDGVGNLGLGTAAPTARLHAESSDNTTPGILVRGPATNGSVVIEQTAMSGGNAARLDFKRNVSGAATTSSTSIGSINFLAYDGVTYYPGAKIASVTTANTTGSGSPANLAFWTTPSGSITASERMRIADTGKVGIGTLTPSALLEVSGTSTSNSILSVHSTSSGSSPIVSVQSASASVPLLDIRSVGNPRLWVGPTTGNVGIGTDSPSSTLDVIGVITAHPAGTGTGQAGQITMTELAANGSESVTLRSPDVISTSYMLTLPPTQGSAGQVLQTDGAGNLNWIDPHINNMMRLTPQASAPASPTAGMMAYNSNNNMICYYNGLSWNRMDGSTACGGGW